MDNTFFNRCFDNKIIHPRLHYTLQSLLANKKMYPLRFGIRPITDKCRFTGWLRQLHTLLLQHLRPWQRRQHQHNDSQRLPPSHLQVGSDNRNHLEFMRWHAEAHVGGPHIWIPETESVVTSQYYQKVSSHSLIWTQGEEKQLKAKFKCFFRVFWVRTFS